MEKPSPEVRAVLRKFCEVQRQKYGPDWKRILAREMSKKSAPFVSFILALGKKNARN